MNDKVDIAELEKQYTELGEMIEKLGGTVKKEEVDVAKAKKKVKAKGDEYDDMDGADEDVEKVKKAEAEKVKKTAEAEAEKVKKAAEVEAEKVKKAAEADDEELVVKGQTIKKSAIGEVQFGLMKSMSQDLEKNTKDIAKAKDEAVLAKLEKRADDEFKHVPGTTQDRAAMLKAVSEMPDPLKKAFEAVFKQSEALAKNAFDMKGSNAGDSEDIKKARQDFESKVVEIKKSDNCTRSEAMTKARQAHPDLFKAYQESSN